MNQNLLQRAAKLNKLRQRKQSTHRAARLISLLIVFATVYALMMPAITMNHEPICGLPEHHHTDECYEVRTELICEKTEEEAHTHTEMCYAEADGIICGREETAPHEHTADCYITQHSITCEIPESEGHTHTEDCYGRGECICPLPEDENHTHDDSCYSREILCGQAEVSAHVHSDACYHTEELLICTQDPDGHTHTEVCHGPVKTLVCEKEETEGHTHSEECYGDRKVLICGMEEHTHTDGCYPEPSDDTAGVETAEIWEATFADVELTDDWAKNVLAIAFSQLGYAENTANFRYDGNEKKGYTRYGAWYGENYGDGLGLTYGDWCAMFVSFCLRYGGVPENLFPSHYACNFWVELLRELGRYTPAESAFPHPGDVVFFRKDLESEIANHVGFVTDVADEKISTIEGNICNSVVTKEYEIGDPCILGYGVLPEKEPEPEETEEEEKDTDLADTAEKEDDREISEFSYANEQLSAKLTVSPALPANTEFLIEKADPAEEQVLWESMSAPVLEKMREEREPQDEQTEPDETPKKITENSDSAEEDEAARVDVFSVKLLADGQEFGLDKSYTIQLEAKLTAPVMDTQMLAKSESLRGFALTLAQTPPAEIPGQEVYKETIDEQIADNSILDEITNSEDADLENTDSENADSEDTDSENTDPENTDLESTSTETVLLSLEETSEFSTDNKNSYVATALGASAADETQPVTLKYEGDGSLRGFALYAAGTLFTETENTPHNLTSGTVAADIDYHNQIDYLGDNAGAGEEEKNKYRLYLDAGTLKYEEPMDLLIVVDGSGDMNADFGGIGKGAALLGILNGENDSAVSDGLISRFLSLHEENEAAVITFCGKGENSDFHPDGIMTDTREIMGWANGADFSGLDSDFTSDGFSTASADICAAYLKMASMLRGRENNGHQKMVIFLSGSVPAYYLKEEEGNYIRCGNGDPADSGNVSECETGTKEFFDKVFGDLAPIYPIFLSCDGSSEPEFLSYTTSDEVRIASTQEQLAQSIEDIIHGSAKKVANLTITDTLSHYVDLVGNISLVAKEKDGTETTLYERENAEETFTDTADDAKCKTFASPLQSLAFDSEANEIKVSLDAPDGLDATTQFTLAFDLETNANADVTYLVKDGYPDTGDEDTDYGENETSSGQQGFTSNKAAKVVYTLAGAEKTADYPKSVVQVLGADANGSGYSVSGSITQHKTIDWLGDKKAGVTNPDTDLDDSTSTASNLKDYYRLYLDAGQYTLTEPIDLLIVLDKSNSMITDSMKDVKDHNGKNAYRYVAIDEIVNGVDGNKGFIENFLSMNPLNQYAVVSFGGAVAGANSDSVKYGHAKDRSYTKDTKLETENWRNTYTRVDCTPNNGDELWGTNYCAALYRAQDMLAKNTSDHKKLMVFISDGVPTFWMDNRNTRYGNGSETGSWNNRSWYNGSYDSDSYYNNNKTVTTKDQNISVTKKCIDELHTNYPNLGIYVIGVASKEKLDTTLLNYMATEGATGVYTSLNYDVLLDSFEKILYGNSGDFKALNIRDTLSEYVDLYGENADIKVTITENNVTKTLYERSTCNSTTDFTDTAGSYGSFFKVDNKKDNKPLITSVSYNADTKTIDVQFNSDIQKLSRTAKYELSFNVKLTPKAKSDYLYNLASGYDPYNGITGDPSTDYKTKTYANTSSSNKPGFHSNTEAIAGYMVGTTSYTIPYVHPVVQTEGSVLNITVKKEWDDSIALEDRTQVSVKLYSAPEDSKELTPVMDPEQPTVPLEIQLNNENNWVKTLEGLRISDSDGKKLSYYIIENPLDGYLAVYYNPVYDMTINNSGRYSAGKVSFPEAPTSGIYTGTATVINNPRLLLPSTGGIGETLYYDFGIMLLASGFILLTRKNLRNRHNLRRE